MISFSFLASLNNDLLLFLGVFVFLRFAASCKNVFTKAKRPHVTRHTSSPAAAAAFFAASSCHSFILTCSASHSMQCEGVQGGADLQLVHLAQDVAAGVRALVA